MFTGMDSLLSQGRRGELVREIDAGRLERRPRTSWRPRRERRWSFWLPREIGVPTGMPHSQKIRRLHDAGFPGRT